MFKRYRDIFLGIFLLAVTGLYYSGTFFEKKLALSAYGGEFVPRIYCAFMLCLSVAILVNGIINVRKTKESIDVAKDEQETFFHSRLGGAKVIASMLLLVCVALMMKPLGFCITTVLYLFLQVVLVIPKERFKFWKVALFVVLFTIAIDVLFVKVFFVPLPVGLIGF